MCLKGNNAMDTDNRFIKLLTISINKKELLLYGFSVPTKQEIHPWKKKKNKNNKLKFNTYFAILSYEEAKHFEQCLTKTEDIPLSNLTLIAPVLIARNPVISYGSNSKLNPISRLSYVRELWNTQKYNLVQQVKTSLKTFDKQLYIDMQELLAQLKAECGIDFSKNGSRFGNYERYDYPNLYCNLEVHCIKKSKGKHIVIQKPMEWKRPLIVNCIAESQERFLFNQIQILQSEDSKLEFNAEETINLCTVYAWDQKTHELVFFKSAVFCNQIILDININETPRMVHDPWSESLISSASNRSEVIHRQIETVERYSSEEPIRIDCDENMIINAANSAKQLLAPYTPTITKGAFVANEQKDGEINSFLKVKEYIDSNDVCYAILADPYFSIQAAMKLLPRILNTNLELTIITSLSSTDPDSGEERNVVEEYRQLLKDNVDKFHNKLYVCNLQRGKKQVFHDRYLIRYHINGKIDGFLLSNSINSMGQFYPFVIAPLEPEVCLSVAEYLKRLQDSNIQKNLPKKQRVNCDVLFDSKQCVELQNQPVEEYADWTSQFLQQNITKSELPNIINEIWKHWKKESEKVCQILSLLIGHTRICSTDEFADILLKNQFISKEYIKCFLSMANKIEQSRIHLNNANKYEYTFWTLLTGKSKPDKFGFAELLDYPHPVYYTGTNWLIYGYHLLMDMDIDCFVNFLEKTCSPMMFYCLTEKLSFSVWSESLYYSLIRSKNECIRLLAIHWLVHLLAQNKLKPNTIFQFLKCLEPDIQLLQITRLLSKSAFQIRSQKSSSNCWNIIFPQLIERATAILPLCTSEQRQAALYWLYDCEECSYCNLYLKLAILTKNDIIQKELLSKAIKIIQEYLLKLDYKINVTKHISLYLDCMEKLYKEQTEKEILNHIVNWNVFETAVEPELKSYNYKQWHNAYIRANWQLDLLRNFLARHPQAQNTVKWLNIWEKRMSLIEHYDNI